MGLKIEATWRKLKTLLEYQQKLVVENRDKARMDRVACKIKRLVYVLEHHTASYSVERPSFDD